MNPQLHTHEHIDRHLKSLNKKHTDQHLIEGLLTHNAHILKHIYQHYAHTIYTFIGDNNGTKEDAKDVFQESLIVLYKMSQKEGFRLTCSFLTLLHSICRRVWLAKLRKRKSALQLETIPPNAYMENSVEQDYIAQERYTFYQEKMQALSVKQRQILELHLEGRKMREIAAIVGLKNEVCATRYKYKCKQLLLQRIRKDERYGELMD